MRARLIVSGGFRSFAGSVESMDPLTSLLQLRDFRSGRIRPVHFEFMPIYVVGKNTAPGARDRHLYSATVGDMKDGDPVLILGRENDQAGDIDAFLLITGFSPGGVLQPGRTIRGLDFSGRWLWRAQAMIPTPPPRVEQPVQKERQR
jgi:hypothetical protein